MLLTVAGRSGLPGYLCTLQVQRKRRLGSLDEPLVRLGRFTCLENHHETERKEIVRSVDFPKQVSVTGRSKII